jgi:hypothetical protein
MGIGYNLKDGYLGWESVLGSILPQTVLHYRYTKNIHTIIKHVQTSLQA